MEESRQHDTVGINIHIGQVGRPGIDIIIDGREWENQLIRISRVVKTAIYEERTNRFQFNNN